MKSGERLDKREARKVEKWLREHADLTAEKQAQALGEVLGTRVAAVTAYRWRRRFKIPSPAEAKRQYPVALTGWELKNYKRLLSYMTVPLPSDFELRVSLEIPGLDEVTIGDTLLRFLVGDDWNIASLWFTPDELMFLKEILEISDTRRGGHLADDLEEIHARATEYANRAFWQGVRKSDRLQRKTPAMNRIPEGRVPTADEQEEQEWVRQCARKLDLQSREFLAAIQMAVTG